MQFLFELFWKLRSGIGGSGFGPNPISHMEIMAWGSNMGVVLSPFEIDTIKKMDNVYLDFANRQAEKK